MHVLLVNPPWAPADLPSLGIGILHAAVSRADPEARVEEIHANLEWLDWIADRQDFTSHDYEYYSIQRYFRGLGDWIFSSALRGRPSSTPAGEEDSRLAMTSWLHALAPRFVEELADRIIKIAPDVVGFAVTFQTTVAALALASQIKHRDPTIVTVFGGANCDGPQGTAIHRNYPFVDFVVRGEGDVTLPSLIRLLRNQADRTDADFATIPGLCWRSGNGRTTTNPLARRPVLASMVPSPDYAGYFERWEASSARHTAEPQLVLESARGCWWADAHACTFCGLNGSMTTFRSKQPERFFAELIDLVRQHQVLDVIAADNIIDNGYYASLLPALARSEYDLRVQYEVRSNLGIQQLEMLAKSGAAIIQPGIENLSSPILKLMRKGLTGYQNVRMLRDAETVGLTVLWNYLYGFPGETERDYDKIVEQIPALHHLFPPQGCSRIQLQRFSPYVESPELGFPDVVPHEQYALSHDLPESELRDLAGLFDAEPRGIPEAFSQRFAELLGTWRQSYAESQLSFLDTGEDIVLTSRRPAFRWDRRLRDPVAAEAFRILERPRTRAALARDLSSRLGRPLAPPALAPLLDQWRALGLVFEESGHLVRLAVPDRNQSLLHLGNTTACRARTDPRHSRYPQTVLGDGDLGEDDASAVAHRLASGGILRVTLPGLVDLADADAGPRTARALSLVRELTAHAIHVEWRARTAPDLALTPFCHLYPPAGLVGGGSDALERWHDRFYVGLCAYRRGPGFIQVRDRRWDELRRFTIDDARYLATIEALSNSVVADVAPDVALALEAESLVRRFGAALWWVPCPLRRWPLPAPL
ncbi:MAG: RiPP maturation radical SAM protein 1 [Dactylosporangium sp.]|nr:RiPP maturation radical SAM C-methyltransferase [Dactylosporangium sp.]NNJ62235.1 RiPP maturation radical SAM protein 1 [Dactylosporangium sp.]